MLLSVVVVPVFGLAVRPAAEVPGLKLVWSDEFNGTSLDRTKWGFETGFVRNREYQYYTDRQENVRVEDGRLIIEGRRETFPNAAYDAAAPTNDWKRCRRVADYTSGSINTLGKFGFAYGRIECRAKVPAGAGTWPAVWMMGTDFAEVRWPKCGEIDVLEYLGKNPNEVTCNLHGYAPEKAKSPNGYYCGGMSKLEGVTPTDGFHVYAAEWTEKGVTMFYDGRPYGLYSFDAFDQKDGTNCFRKPHFILVNLALGAEWMMPKAQMAKDFPVRYEIDWIRVYAPSGGQALALRP